MNIKQHIPNLLTLGNLFCGVLAILHLSVSTGYFCDYDPRPMIILGLMSLSLLFDLLDGMVARLLKVSSNIGKELDSLADMVSFGVLPSLMMVDMMLKQTNLYMSAAGFLIALMSAYRLAKFNIDEDQSDKFKGVPTPFNAIFIWSLFYLFYQENAVYLHHYYVLVAVTVCSSFLLVSNIPLLALKFKSLAWKENQAKYILILGAIILLIVFKLVAIPLILPWYLVVSLLHYKARII